MAVVVATLASLSLLLFPKSAISLPLLSIIPRERSTASIQEAMCIRPKSNYKVGTEKIKEDSCFEEKERLLFSKLL